MVALKLGTTVDERELGYWLHVAHTGKGFALEAGLAVVRVGFDLEALDAIELRTDPDNRASARVAHKLGFHGPVLDPLSQSLPDRGKVEARGSAREQRCDAHVYTLSRVEYVDSPARNTPIEAYDVLERRVL